MSRDNAYIIAYDHDVFGFLEDGFEDELMLDDNTAEIVNDEATQLDENFFTDEDSNQFRARIVSKCFAEQKKGKTVLLMYLEDFMSMGIIEMLESVNKAHGGDALTFIFRNEEDGVVVVDADD